MANELSGKIETLAHKIRVLEEENAQLAERAEDSLLLGLVSAKIQDLSDASAVFESTLERVSIVKAIPFATCGRLDATQVTPLASYATFSDQQEVGYPIILSPETCAQLSAGPAVVRSGEGLRFHFDPHLFTPTWAAIVPFNTHSFSKGIFVFMDDAPELDRLSPMLVLLGQVVHMAVARHDTIYLLGALREANKGLESRVAQRTRDLSSANQELQQEMTERKASQRALQESHETYLTVLNSIDASIYVADLASHEILFMNQCMIDIFGEDLTGKSSRVVFAERSRPEDEETHPGHLNGADSPGGAVMWQAQNPRNGRWYLNYKRVIKWTDGRQVKLQIATDITRLKAMETQLYQAQKFEAIGTLAGGIAHDFNNLLMGIQGRTSLLATELTPSPSLTEHTEAIETYIRSGAHLTSQLLGFASGGKYEVRPIDINALLVESATMFGRTRKEIRLHTKLQEPAPVVAVDRRQLEHVFLNLFINAWQAMPDGGELCLETRRVSLSDDDGKLHDGKAGDYAKLSISDTGIGMDKSTCQQIFDPFFTTKDKERGTGLGLASAYGIIKNHKGAITVYSEVDQGTTFNIYLPIAEQAPLQEPRTTKGIVAGSGTILIVDDEEMIRTVAGALLTSIGYQVLVTDSGEKAIALVEEKQAQLDLVILDMIMPGLDGGKTFDRIRHIQPRMPVLLSSGYAINGQAQEIMRRGCNGFIQKPFTLSELSRKVGDILAATRTPAPST